MSSDSTYILVSCTAVMILLAAVMAGVDFYLNLDTSPHFFSILGMNLIFTMSGGFILLLAFILMLTNESITIKFFRNDTVRTWTGLLVSCVLIYFEKKFLMGKFDVVFKYDNLIVLLEVLSLMIIPYMCYRFLEKFGKAFAH